MLEVHKVNAAIFPSSRANNSSCSGPIGSMIELIQILLNINILPKFGADWSIFVDARSTQSQMQQFFPVQEQITPVVLVQLDP